MTLSHSVHCSLTPSTFLLPDTPLGEAFDKRRYLALSVNGYMESALELEVIATSLADEIEHGCKRFIEWGKVGIRIEVIALATDCFVLYTGRRANTAYVAGNEREFRVYSSAGINRRMENQEKLARHSNVFSITCNNCGLKGLNHPVGKCDRLRICWKSGDCSEGERYHQRQNLASMYRNHGVLL